MNEAQALYAVTYLLSFRLAVLLLGGVAIYLGYRLFTSAMTPGRQGGDGGELATKFGSVEMTLKSAAPGTFFAAFGALITTVVLTSSPPEFSGKRAVEAAPDGETRTTTSTTVRTDVVKNAETHQQIYARLVQTLATAHQESIAIAKANPEYAEYQHLRARLDFVAGEFDDAVASQERALDVVPDADLDSYRRWQRAFEAGAAR